MSTSRQSDIRYLPLRRRRRLLLLLPFFGSTFDVSVAFPNQAGSCSGVGGPHTDRSPSVLPTSLVRRGFVVTVNDRLFLREGRPNSILLASDASILHLKVRANSASSPFKGALIRVKDETPPHHTSSLFEVEASTRNAMVVDDHLCSGNENTVQAVSHRHALPKRELGALLHLGTTTAWDDSISVLFSIDVTVVEVNNSTHGSVYSKSRFSLEVEHAAASSSDEGSPLFPSFQSMGQKLEQEEDALTATQRTSTCPTLCPNTEVLRDDGTMVRYNNDWIDCHDLDTAASTTSDCRATQDLARDYCCVTPVCYAPCRRVAWPDARVPLPQQGGYVSCRDLTDRLDLLVAVRSCRISRMLVELHCGCGAAGRDKTRATRSGSTINAGRPHGWRMILLMLVSLGLACCMV